MMGWDYEYPLLIITIAINLYSCILFLYMNTDTQTTYNISLILKNIVST